MKNGHAAKPRLSPINLIFWLVIASIPIAVILLLLNAENNKDIPVAIKQKTFTGTTSTTAIAHNSDSLDYVDDNSPAKSIPATDDVLQLNAIRIADEQARHMNTELQDNENLPEDERSRLAPNADALRAMETGESLIQ